MEMERMSKLSPGCQRGNARGRGEQPIGRLPACVAAQDFRFLGPAIATGSPLARF
jgi:hypothetical protein